MSELSPNSMNRAFYSSSIPVFHSSSPYEILGKLSDNSEFADEQTQKSSWKEEIRILQEVLKPLAMDVRYNVDPIHWFLDGRDDVRSSYYLEDVATEFQVQGLELDWACITWDADFRYSEQGWEYRSFAGKKWQNINKEERKKYLKNAYRVLLTRARQGMIIVVPSGDNEDPTRKPAFYDGTFEYLKSIGFEVV